MLKPMMQDVTMFEFHDFSSENMQEVNLHTDNHLKEHNFTETNLSDDSNPQMLHNENLVNMDKYKKEMLELKQSILEEAEKEAEAIKSAAKEAGYKAGYDEGFTKGKERAILEYSEEFAKEKQLFGEEVKIFIERAEVEKDRLTASHMENLKELAIAVAEKVINVSLKSSGEVIKNMLAAAIEKSKNKQWAKVYISSHDEDLTLEGDTDILDMVNSISGQVKVEILENKPSGTCIIEFPDQIIDASTETQLDNIKQILSAQSG